MIYCIVRYQSNLTADCGLDAVVCRSKWTYVHGTAAVVLNNLVARLVRATADNPGFLACVVSFLWIWLGAHFLSTLWKVRGEGTYNGDGILTHILKPYGELAVTTIGRLTDVQSHMSLVMALP